MAATPAQIDRLLSAKDTAEKESEFAESIRCTATNISGDRYKITFSEVSAEGDKE